MSLPGVLPNDALNKFQDSPYLLLKSAGSLFSRMSNISAARTQITNPNRLSIFHVQKTRILHPFLFILSSPNQQRTDLLCPFSSSDIKTSVD